MRRPDIERGDCRRIAVMRDDRHGFYVVHMTQLAAGEVL